ncbi:Uncharacterised protein [Yersinia nurmii]|uniref:Uncharacterized protein n=1 Tax=Yersinia nurmii TaxID=685706 RepID=A0ABM9SH50_9GAMM|nr:Uncharacterised protein [Yersinia nurmii]
MSSHICATVCFFHHTSREPNDVQLARFFLLDEAGS